MPWRVRLVRGQAKAGGGGEPNSHGTPASPTTSLLGTAAGSISWASIYFPPCFKERRDQRDLNKVGEQRPGDLRAGAMPMSSRRGNSNRIVYDMHAPFKLAGRAGAQGPVRQPSPACFQRPLYSTQPNDGASGHYCCAHGLGNFTGEMSMEESDTFTSTITDGWRKKCMCSYN